MMISQPLKKFENEKQYLVETDFFGEVMVLFCEYNIYELDDSDTGFYTWERYTRVPNENIIEVREVLPGDDNDSKRFL